MFAQVSQSDVVTCMYVQAVRCSRLNHLLTTHSCVYVPGSAGLPEWEQFVCLLFAFTVTGASWIRPGFSARLASQIWFCRRSKKAVFTHTWTPRPAFPHSRFWPTRFAAPCCWCSHPIVSSEPRLSQHCLSCSQRAPVPEALGTRPNSMQNKPTAQLLI